MPTPKQFRLEQAPNGRDRTLKCGEDTFIDWKAGVIMSNNTGTYQVEDVGVSKQIIRVVSKEDFVDYDLADLAESFDLTVSHIKMLTVMLTQERYVRIFKWDIETRQSLSDATGLSVNTLQQVMPSLHLKKNLVIKIQNGIYKLNKEILTHRLDIKELQRIDRVMSYRFSDKKDSALTVEKGGVLLNREFVERINSIYNKQIKGEEINSGDLGEFGFRPDDHLAIDVIRKSKKSSHVKNLKARPNPLVVEESKNKFE